MSPSDQPSTVIIICIHSRDLSFSHQEPAAETTPVEAPAATEAAPVEPEVAAAAPATTEEVRATVLPP